MLIYYWKKSILWTLSWEQGDHWTHCKKCLFQWPFYSGTTTIKASLPSAGS